MDTFPRPSKNTTLFPLALKSRALPSLSFNTTSDPLLSRMENAYGRFSVQNTVRISFSAFEGLHYSEIATDMDFVDGSEKEK